MSVLRNLQASVVSRLASQPFLAGVSIIQDNQLDILNTIQTALSKLGVCIVVTTPTASVCSPNSPRPYFEKVNLICRCIENPTINRSKTGLGLTAYDVSEFCAICLHSWSPFLEGSSTVEDVNTSLICANPSISIIPDKSFLIMDARFSTSLGIDSSLLLAPPNPVVTNANPSIRFTNQGVLDIFDSGTSVWLDIGLQSGQLFLSPPATDDTQNLRFVGGSWQLLDDVLNVWMTVGASNGQLFVDPTNSPTISNVQFSGGSLQIYDSVLLKWMSLGVNNGQLFLS
jgi:hypothetical protein